MATQFARLEEDRGASAENAARYLVGVTVHLTSVPARILNGGGQPLVSLREFQPDGSFGTTFLTSAKELGQQLTILGPSQFTGMKFFDSVKADIEGFGGTVSRRLRAVLGGKASSKDPVTCAISFAEEGLDTEVTIEAVRRPAFKSAEGEESE